MGKNKPLLWTAVLSAVGTTSAFAQITGTPAAGEYYLKDVATGKFLGQGNAYGTQASLNHGLLFTMTVDGGKYILDSKVNRDANNHFLGNNGYVDSPAYGFEITEVKGKPGHYVIKAGDKYLATDGNIVSVNAADVSKAAVWQILPVKDMNKLFGEASFEKPADATFYIKSANFSIHSDNTATAKAVWNVGNVNFTVGGNNTNLVAESWKGNINAHQTLTGIPNGLYRLKAQCFDRWVASLGGDAEANNSTKTHAKLFANTQEVDVPSVNREAEKTALKGSVPNSMGEASDAFSKDLYWSDPVYVYVSDGSLELGIKKDEADGWLTFDNFTLDYIGDVNVDAVRKELTEKLAFVINQANKYTDDETLRGYALEASSLQARINKLTSDNAETYPIIAAYKNHTKGNIGEEIDNLGEDIKKANANYEAYVAAKGRYASLEAAAADLKTTYEAQPEETQKIAKETYENAVKAVQDFKDAVEAAYKAGTAADIYSAKKLEEAVNNIIGEEGTITVAKNAIVSGGTNDFSYANVVASIKESTTKYNAHIASLNNELCGPKDGDIYADTYVEALKEMNVQKGLIDDIKKQNDEKHKAGEANEATQKEFTDKLAAANAAMQSIYEKYISYSATLRANYKAACADVEGITAKLKADVKDLCTIAPSKPENKPTAIESVQSFYAEQVKAIETAIEALQANVDAANVAHTVAAAAPFCEKYNEDKAAIEKTIGELSAKVAKSVAEYNANEASKSAIAGLQTAFNNNKSGVKDGFAGVDNLTSDDKAYTTKGRFAKSEAAIQTAIDALTAAAAEAYKVDGTGKAGEFFGGIANDKKINDKETRLGTASIQNLIDRYKLDAEVALINYNRVAAELVKYDKALNGYDIPAKGKEGDADYEPAKHVDGLKDVAKNTEVTVDGTYEGKTYAKAISEIEEKIGGVKKNLGEALAKEDVEHLKDLQAVAVVDGLEAQIKDLSDKYTQNETNWNKEQLKAAKARMLDQATTSVSAARGVLPESDYAEADYGKKAADLNKEKKAISDALTALDADIDKARSSEDDAEAIALLATVNAALNESTDSKPSLIARVNKLVKDAEAAKANYDAEKAAKAELAKNISVLKTKLLGGKLDDKTSYAGVAATAGSDLFTTEIANVKAAIEAIENDVNTSFTAETVRADREDAKNDKGEVTKAGFNSRVKTAGVQVDNLLTLAKNEADNTKATADFNKKVADAKVADAIAKAFAELNKDENATSAGRAYYLAELAKYNEEYDKIVADAAAASAAKAKSGLDGAIKDNAKYTDTAKNMTASQNALSNRLTTVKANIDGLVALAKANEAEHNAQVKNVESLQTAWDKVFETVTSAPASTAHEAAIKKLNEIKKSITELSTAVETSFGKGASVADKLANDNKYTELNASIKSVGDSWEENYDEAVSADNKARYESYKTAYSALVKAYQDETALVTKMSKLSYATGDDASDVLINITGKDGIYSKIDDIRNLNTKANESYIATASPTLWDATEDYKAKAEQLKADIEALSKKYADEVNKVAQTKYSNEYNAAKGMYDAAVADMQSVLHIEEKAAKAHLADINTILVEAEAVKNAKDFAYKLDETILPAFATVADKIASVKAEAAVAEWSAVYSAAMTLADEEYAKIQGFDIDVRDEQTWSNEYALFVEESIDAASEAWDAIEGDKYANYEVAYSVLNNFISTKSERKVGEKQEGDKVVDIKETHTARYWNAYDEEQKYQNNNEVVAAMHAKIDELQGKLDAAAEYAGTLVVETKMIASVEVTQNNIDYLESIIRPTLSQRSFNSRVERIERSIANIYSKAIDEETGEIGVLAGGLRMDYENAAAVYLDNEEKLKELDAYKATIDKYVSQNDSVYKAYTIGIVESYDKDGAPVYKKDAEGNVVKSTNEEVHAAYLALEQAIGVTKSELTAIFDEAAAQKAVEAIEAAIAESDKWIENLQSKLDECSEPKVADEQKDALQKELDDTKAYAQNVKDRLAAVKEANTVLIYEDNIIANAESLVDEDLADDIAAINKKYVDNKNAYARLSDEINGYNDRRIAIYNAADEYEYKQKGEYTIPGEDDDMTIVFDTYRDYQNYLAAQKIDSEEEKVDNAYNDIALDDYSEIDGDRITSILNYMEMQLARYNESQTVEAVSSVVSAANNQYDYITQSSNDRFYPSAEVRNALLQRISDMRSAVSKLQDYASLAGMENGTWFDLDGNAFKDAEGNDVKKTYIEVYPSIMAKAAELKTAADQLKKDVKDESCMYGDIDNNDKINVNDYNVIRNHIIGRAVLEEGSTRFISADVNHDGKVNIGDAIQIGNYIMYEDFRGNNYYPYNAAQRISALSEQNESNGVLLSAEGNGTRQTITVKLADTKNFVGAQMNLMLPEGVNVISEASEGHEVLSNDVDGVHRVLVSDLENKQFGDNAVVTIVVEVTSNYKGGAVQLSDALFADAQGRTVLLGGGTIEGTTGITELTFGEKVMSKVYSIGGQLMNGVKKGYNVIVNPDGSAKKVLKK